MIRRALLLCVVAIVALASLPDQVAAFAAAPAPARGSRVLKGASSPSSRSANASPNTALYAVRKGTEKSATKKTKKKKSSKKKASVVGKEEVVNFKKADFISAVSEKTGMTKAESDMALAAVLNVIASEVSDGKRINLPGFGTFKLNFRQARKGRNPATGEEIDIKASYSPSFSASKSFKDMCNPDR